MPQQKPTLPFYKRILSPLISPILIRYGYKKLIKENKTRSNNLTPEFIIDFMFSKQEGLGGLIIPWQEKTEFLNLLKIVDRQKPACVLEIGTANGGTLFSFCRLAKDDATVISIDLPHGKFGRGYPSWKIPVYESFAKKDQTIHLLREDSHSPLTLEKAKKLLNGKKVDFLFIDADHTYEGVKQDFLQYRELVSENGIIAFHDIAHNPNPVYGVEKLWHEIKNDYKYTELIQDKNQGGYGIGVLEMNKK